MSKVQYEHDSKRAFSKAQILNIIIKIYLPDGWPYESGDLRAENGHHQRLL